MSTARALVAFAVVGLAAFAVTAYARQAEPAGQGEPQFVPDPIDPAGLGGFDWSELAIPIDDITREISNLGDEIMGNHQPISGMSSDANVRALLETIKQSEGTASAPDPYRVCYAYRHTIVSLSEHPAVSGEWRGERLSDAQCAGAGERPGCVSTAAGAYQIIRPTWLKLRASLGLSDFGPASQDAAAIELLRQTGALARIAAGDLPGAVARARKTWASLPGANYAGQGMRSMAQVQAWYTGNGGALA